MQIKRKDLELIEQALARGVDKRCQRAHDFNKAAWELVKALLILPDPVDAVPVQDYPFPIPTPKRSVNIPDMVKPVSEGPT